MAEVAQTPDSQITITRILDPQPHAYSRADYQDFLRRVETARSVNSKRLHEELCRGVARHGVDKAELPTGGRDGRYAVGERYATSCFETALYLGEALGMNVILVGSQAIHLGEVDRCLDTGQDIPDPLDRDGDTTFCAKNADATPGETNRKILDLIGQLAPYQFKPSNTKDVIDAGMLHQGYRIGPNGGDLSSRIVLVIKSPVERQDWISSMKLIYLAATAKSFGASMPLVDIGFPPYDHAIGYVPPNFYDPRQDIVGVVGKGRVDLVRRDPNEKIDMAKLPPYIKAFMALRQLKVGRTPAVDDLPNFHESVSSKDIYRWVAQYRPALRAVLDKLGLDIFCNPTLREGVLPRVWPAMFAALTPDFGGNNYLSAEAKQTREDVAGLLPGFVDQSIRKKADDFWVAVQTWINTANDSDQTAAGIYDRMIEAVFDLDTNIKWSKRLSNMASKKT